MFNFFKKKKDNEQISQESAEAVDSSLAANQNEQQAGAQAVEDKKIAVGNDITIHVMPERFRSAHVKSSQAKTTGLIIVVGGVLFLIVVAALLYFYLFSRGADNSGLAPAPSAPETAAVEKNKTGADKISGEASAEEKSGALNKEATGTPETEPFPAENTTAETAELGLGATSTPEEAEAAAGARPSDLSISADSDQDGLTDKEEELIGSGAASRDSDQDGYDDLSEMMNLYNPAGPDKLLANPNIKSYFNTAYHYSLLYPAGWQQSEIAGADSVMFKSGDQQFMQIIVQPNAGGESISGWYNKQFGEHEAGGFGMITTDSWQGIKNEDGLTVYLTDYGYKYIFILTYNPGLSKTLDYKNIFEMMIKSFEIGR
ncbi:hypothetical protein KKC04_00840 [Patescibacteria group bacterium]|nr:hypothetical protein [Patescibacteria group bacterium]